MRRTNTKARRGYTLVEVLIVVTIIGIASAVIVPHMLTASVLGIQAASRTVIADLLYAQNEAIAHQTPHRVVIDTDKETYFLQRQNADGEWPESGDADFKLRLQWREGSADDLIDFTTDDRFGGIALAKATKAGAAWTFVDDAGMVIITFNELGSPSFGALDVPTPDAAIGLVSKTEKYVVSVAPFTGRVTVQKP